jgi:hypothetical protein
MTPLDQLELWVQGQNVHNVERNECCPDFACCQPNNHFSIEARKKFLHLYKTEGLKACLPLMAMAMEGALAGAGINARVITLDELRQVVLGPPDSNLLN